MNIFYWGQRGIPAHAGDTAEQRVEALGGRFAAQGHNVSATCAVPYSSRNIGHFNGMRLLHKASFDPSKPGGFFHLFLGILSIWRNRPDVIHLHGWKAAALIRFGAFLAPESTFVWTIDTIPVNHPGFARIIATQAAPVCDALSTPSRTIQYRLLTEFGIRVTYIPDGYVRENISLIPASTFGLRKGGYLCATAQTKQDLQWLVRSYRNAKIRKPLVVLTSNTELAGVASRNSFLRVIEHPTARMNTSVIQQAAAYISLKSDTSSTLMAMDAGIPIIATTGFDQEEVLGTTALFIRPRDSKGLAEALRTLKKTNPKARKRAQRHFAWERILEDYQTLYRYPAVRRIPLDSLHRVPLQYQVR